MASINFSWRSVSTTFLVGIGVLSNVSFENRMTRNIEAV
jgi:hypothetical protein